jgi:hypothetical protein
MITPKKSGRDFGEKQLFKKMSYSKDKKKSGRVVGFDPQPHGSKPCALPTELDRFVLFLCSKIVDNTTELGAKICGTELGVTSTPRRPGCANAARTSAP